MNASPGSASIGAVNEAPRSGHHVRRPGDLLPADQSLAPEPVAEPGRVRDQVLHRGLPGRRPQDRGVPVQTGHHLDLAELRAVLSDGRVQVEVTSPDPPDRPGYPSASTAWSAARTGASRLAAASRAAASERPASGSVISM